MSFERHLEAVARRVFDFYWESAKKERFNGLPAISRSSDVSEVEWSQCVEQLIADRVIDCVWDINPHIKRFPERSVAKQLELVAEVGIENACLYPSRRALSRRVQPQDFGDKPFSRALLLGGAQLSFVAFEMAVLQRYREDPRYKLSFHDYMGNMSIADAYYEAEATLDRDRISVQSFGLGFDDSGTPHIIAFHRYLADLTPEHQQYWRSFISDQTVRMSDPYFESSIVGDWWENRSGRFAIAEEMRIINEVSTKNWSENLFRVEMEDDLTFDLTAFLVPSVDGYGRFVHAWDKLLSDNIRKRFFEGQIEIVSEEEVSPGRFREREKATISLLEEWLTHLKLDTDLVGKIVKPLREVRKLRQKPAHTFTKNAYSHDFHEARVSLLKSIHGSLRLLRRSISTLAGDSTTSIPEWLDGEQIEFF